MRYFAAWGKIGIDFGVTYNAENNTFSKLKFFFKRYIIDDTIHWTKRNLGHGN